MRIAKPAQRARNVVFAQRTANEPIQSAPTFSTLVAPCTTNVLAPSAPTFPTSVTFAAHRLVPNFKKKKASIWLVGALLFKLVGYGHIFRLGTYFVTCVKFRKKNACLCKGAHH